MKCMRKNSSTVLDNNLRLILFDYMMCTYESSFKIEELLKHTN